MCVEKQQERVIKMKDLIIAAVLLMALIINFSFCGYSPMEIVNGSGTHQKGDSGLIVPGKGDALAKTIIEPESIPERSERADKAETAEVTEVTEVTSEVIHTENIRKDKVKMEGMLISFWHGVAAVLIGETSALMVAIAWMKIRGNKDA
jgi:hypothetical protein